VNIFSTLFLPFSPIPLASFGFSTNFKILSARSPESLDLTKNPSLKSKISVKKPRGKSLEKRDKKHNRSLSRECVVIEHVIGRMKKFRIMGDKFRNRLKRYDDMTSIVSGLINFRVMM
jgi:hypothetical protein